MLLRTYDPRYPLSMFVDYFWYMQDYSPGHSRELALPDGSVEIVIDLRQDNVRLYDSGHRELLLRSSLVCGPHTEYFVIDSSGESTVIGIHFKPGGIRPFMKQSLDELLNAHVSLDMLWGTRADEVRDELLECAEPEMMFRALERRLLSLACHPLERHAAVQYALDRLQRSHVGDIIEGIGMSHRKFNQIFKEEVGMTPKRLSRLFRFQEALNRIISGEELVWTDVAIECGYYDQAHFIKDFQSFSGISPSAYRPISGRHHNHSVISE
ncbi:DUF6597 domain-containing transcriptional factor [Paenibacillus allorhizosphaerae]|uniref:HTH araC/xylS-type domain-containing protein n=1 Tax=Paenibacillus allorhizosphaerae TaxID=2849866 RepID=A0ABN7TWC3_9BACL|nr:helix-turn-helix domain-containing protein [Paenibacillus allorhizosphaerae]CAG7654798.1 hypothetical protein PAECIP111802_05882 [Paenibacillus allorhizosphaerae]